jgi:hypothetical protein
MEAGGSSSPRKPVGFLDLPYEIRHRIYRFCLVCEDPIDMSKTFDDCHYTTKETIHDYKSLLLVSKLVGFGAAEGFYMGNVFQFDVDEKVGSDVKMCFSETNLQRIRKIQLMLRPHELPCCYTLDPEQWSPILARLRKLSIVVKRPLPNWTYVHEHRIDCWGEWLGGILRYITSQLSSSCIIEVDDGDEAGTTAIIRECLPSGYRTIQLVPRKNCSWASEYLEDLVFANSKYWVEDYYDSTSETE